MAYLIEQFQRFFITQLSSQPYIMSTPSSSDLNSTYTIGISSSLWVLDSGASHHMSPSSSSFVSMSQFLSPTSVMTIDGTHMPLVGVGSVCIPHLSLSILRFKTYYESCISVSQLCEFGYSASFSSTSCEVQDLQSQRLIRTGRKQGGLYVLDELRVPDVAASGGWATAPDGPYAWGYCFKEERGSSDRYRGRGPIQLTYDYNYAQAGSAIGVHLRNNPDLVANDPVVSFKTALWFWMTPQPPKPSSHDVITGRWRPSAADSAAGRVPGYGVITNIINGVLECSRGNNPKMQDRIGFYRRYCSSLGVSTGDNLDCANQRPFA